MKISHLLLMAYEGIIFILICIGFSCIYNQTHVFGLALHFLKFKPKIMGYWVVCWEYINLFLYYYRIIRKIDKWFTQLGHQWEMPINLQIINNFVCKIILLGETYCYFNVHFVSVFGLCTFLLLKSHVYHLMHLCMCMK